jgi:hypothetical protein
MGTTFTTPVSHRLTKPNGNTTEKEDNNTPHQGDRKPQKEPPMIVPHTRKTQTITFNCNFPRKNRFRNTSPALLDNPTHFQHLKETSQKKN